MMGKFAQQRRWEVEQVRESGGGDAALGMAKISGTGRRLKKADPDACRSGPDARRSPEREVRDPCERAATRSWGFKWMSVHASPTQGVPCSF